MTTTDPWLAWPSGSDPAELATRLRVAHERFLTGETGGREPGSGRSRRGQVRRVVLDSWLRSRSSGVDPELMHPPVDGTTADLLAYRSEHPLAVLMPLVRRLLGDGLGSDGMIVAVADATGWLLWVEGDRAVRRDVARAGFVEGARWGERDAGTNAPGVALATDHAVQVFAAEHFSRVVQPWSCSAAPVHDPMTGQLLGVLDLTGRDVAASPHVLALVRATAAAMESELEVRALEAQLAAGRRRGAPALARPARVRADPPTGPLTAPPAAAPYSPPYFPPIRLEVLGTSSPMLHRGGDPQVLTLRHAELLVLLGTHPGGLTGEELAALLHPGYLSGVTVRAELSRLRRTVGPLLGGSRPYRLAARLRTDLDDVRERLARGDVAGAVQAYRGPVLPRSQAPGIGALREELAAELRAAMARTRDLGALEEWTSSGAAGSDDWSAWQRLLELEVDGSPGWIRARARADLLERELAGAPGPADGGPRDGGPRDGGPRTAHAGPRRGATLAQRQRA